MSVDIAVEAAGRSVGDHVCWPYQGHADLVDSTMPYLAEGIRRNERVVLVTDVATRRCFVDAGLHALGDEHQLLLLTPEQAPGSSGSMGDGVAELEQMTRDAVRDRWTGLRMLADVTSRVVDAGSLDSYLTWEHCADHVRFAVPYTTLCAYDEQVLGTDAVGHLACLHSVMRGDHAQFRLVASRRFDAALIGAVDAGGVGQLSVALGSIGLNANATVDAHEVDFLHHRALLALDAYAATKHSRLIIVEPPALTERIVDLLDLVHLTIVERA